MRTLIRTVSPITFCEVLGLFNLAASLGLASIGEPLASIPSLVAAGVLLNLD